MTGATEDGAADRPRRPRRQRKQVLLRLDPLVHDALARWAADDLRSTNAQIEFLLRRALLEAGRLPGATGPLPRRGRPPRREEPETGG
ncbi:MULTISPECIES: hypothetical protein [Streptomyces]|uniref:Toxin-antitoxin system HicB family antitoxin n=4 Tax=Streptomyces TaxID=1883 RepID=A0A8H9HTD2_9ACTN|nr:MULTISPECIES: hypothetical protein [Streptomyces]NEC16271.1 hypothetical protein [Streptomyces sp. SID8014]MDQ0295432.1 hypothetical protein [Streptomyces sp. DSM 41037]PJM84886.1 hypothetical protein CH313_02565 [Streptomyces sp. TSRI0384-2]QNE81261.1 hypothetical protein F0345_09215 [Streptomyces rutgersensis]WPR51223.1 hypothetical protein SJI45_09425 [Streptomyces sp. S399]